MSLQCKPCLKIRDLLFILKNNLTMFFSKTKKDIESHKLVNYVACELSKPKWQNFGPQYDKPINKYNLIELYRKYKRDRESKKLINQVVRQLSEQAPKDRIWTHYWTYDTDYIKVLINALRKTASLNYKNYHNDSYFEEMERLQAAIEEYKQIKKAKDKAEVEKRWENIQKSEKELKELESKKLVNDVAHQLSRQASKDRLSFSYMDTKKDNNEKT
jgi:hypothetical protein